MENDLRPAEKKVVEAFEKRENFVIVKGDFLRGSFLRRLFLGEYGNWEPREVVIAGATISELNMNYCQIRHPLSFLGCTFEEGISLRNSTLQALFLPGCVVMKSKGSDFAIRALGAEISGDVNLGEFSGDRFTAKGEVVLIGANIGGQVACAGGIFENDLILQRIRAESLLLIDNFKSKGNVNLTGAILSGQLLCRKCCIGGDFYAQTSKSLNAIFREIKFMGNFDLIGSEIREQVSCDRGYFEGQLDFQDLRAGSVIFRDFQGKGEVNFNGAEVRGGLEWLARMKGDEFQPQPYEQLIAVYRRMGHTNWARKVGFELEKQRHRKFKKIKEHKEDKDRDCGWWNFWYGVLRRTIGYGYKPFRSFRLALYGWLVGALLFGGANLHDCGWPVQSPKDLFWILGGENRSECSSCLFVPSEGDVLVSEDWKLRKQIPENYPQFVPAVYALEALFPVFDFGQLDKWHPGKVWLSGARWLLTFFGTVILAILTFFGIGVLGPRWRSDEDNS